MNKNWVFSQVLLHFLFVFKPAEHPLLLTHLQPRRLKINLIHSLLVSSSHTAALADCLLRNESAKFCVVVPECVPCVYRGTGGARGEQGMAHRQRCVFILYQDLYFHLCSS